MARIRRDVAHGVQTSSGECLDALVDAVRPLTVLGDISDSSTLTPVTMRFTVFLSLTSR